MLKKLKIFKKFKFIQYLFTALGLIIVLAISNYIACSEVDFVSNPGTCIDYQTIPGQKCKLNPEGTKTFTVEHRAGRVDILFVNDNSGSMSAEHQKMAERFSDFMESIGNLDYKIAMVTTDISASPNNNARRKANGNGSFQDGRFLWFTQDGSLVTKVLQKGDDNESLHIDLFEETVQRAETLECEEAGRDNRATACPSTDERAIYAVNLAFDRFNRTAEPEASFIRKEAHLAIIILSDEDERSKGGSISGYELEDMDLPATLVQRFNIQINVHEDVNKTFSVHAIAIEPGDASCLSKQSEQEAGVLGQYGHTYYQLVYPSDHLFSLNSEEKGGGIVEGHMGSICADDYVNELGDIAHKIQDNVEQIILGCDPISTPTLTFTHSDLIDFTLDGNVLTLNEPLPAEGTVSVSYTCNSWIGQ